MDAEAKIVIHLNESVATGDGKFIARNMTVRRSPYEKPIEFHKYVEPPDLTDIDAVSIFIKTDTEEKAVVLPHPMQVNLARYLKERPDKTRGKSDYLDCGEFAYFINGVDYQTDYYDEKLWDIEDFTSESLQTGDTIILTGDKEYRNILHWTIYLDKDLYLSKFGAGGIFVTNLDTMINYCGASHAFRVKKIVSPSSTVT